MEIRQTANDQAYMAMNGSMAQYPMSSKGTIIAGIRADSGY